MAAEKRQRETEEITKKALRELRGPTEFDITNEERLTMRNIPYFVLPSYETVPRTDHIGAKIDTRNTSYIPASKKSPPATIATSSKIPDYRHVRSKVDTGRKYSGGSLVKGHGSIAMRPRSRSTPSLHRTGPFPGQLRTVSTCSQLPARPSSAVKYKSVKPRVNSLDNIHHTPGGGNKSQSPVRSSHLTNHSSKVKVAWETPQVEKPVSFEKGHVKSRIDHSDPNPAHKLKHSLEELTLPQGRKVNPRFAERKNKSPRRYSSTDTDQLDKKKPVAKSRERKSVTFGALEYSDTKPKFLEDLPKALPSTSEVMEQRDIISHSPHDALHNGDTSHNEAEEDCLTLTDIEVTNTDTSTTIVLTNLWKRSSLAQEESLHTITENEEVGFYEVEDDDQLLVAASTHSFPHGIPSLCVRDETGELVEVIVDPPAVTEKMGHLSEECTDEEDLSKLILSSNGSIGLDDTSTSTRL